MIAELTPIQGDEDRQRSESLSLRPSRPPTQVPGYEPEHFLGKGAFGEVWVAVDLNTRRRVAIKFYAHRGGLDWSLLSREVEKLAFLFNDRYVVQLMKVGWDAEPPYYIMEYLERGSLEERLQQGPLPVVEAISLLREVAQGLVHAHGKGIMHCDLKPANILLDQDGKPRLADFGQARLSHEHSPALGTLFYMAPEQADLKAVPDARWDVYALGAVLYRMLTGQTPYRDVTGAGEIQQAVKLEERLERYRRFIRHSPAPALHRKLPGVDAALADLVDRCLAVKPEKRFRTVQAVLSALDQRALRHARRPLLVLGAVGPALGVLVMALLAWRGFTTTVDQSSAALNERSLQSNRFAATFVARAIARQIDQRWRILEQEASEDEFRMLLKNATGKPWDHPERQQLQDRLEKLYARHQDSTRAYFWFVDDAAGNELALGPLKRENRETPTIDQNFAYRDYFHGGRQDAERGKSPPPIQRAHLSRVYESRAAHTRMVAFSVPVWDADDSKQDRHVLGVLVLALKLGELEVRLGEEGDTEAAVKKWVLVDTKEDQPGSRGRILQHPSNLFEAGTGRDFPHYTWDPELVESLRRLRHCRCDGDHSCDEEALLRQYHDPVGRDDAAFDGDWMAAVEPVLVDGRPREDRDTGWVVVVQEYTDDAVAPVHQLRKTLLAQGLVGLVLMLGVVTSVWGFVIVLLNDASRSRLTAFLRRKAGLAASTSTGSQGRSEGTGTGLRQRSTASRSDGTDPGKGRAAT